MRSSQPTRTVVAGFLALACGFAQAQDSGSGLAAQIETQLNARHADKGLRHHVTIKTPQAQWPTCQRPKLTLPDNNRLTGNMSVAVQCERKQFLQVTIDAEGRYWVASEAIPAGSPIGRSQITEKQGSLARLPASLVFNPQEIVGSVAARALNPGQPIVAGQLRKSWVIKTGDEVDVILSGEGFRVRSKGRATTNAATGEPVRVRMASGQVITGSVDDSGTVMVAQ